ncbi:Flp pilus assembly protein TadD, contains TPR repeats [Rhodovulum sp. ES.010]|uniref:tetratricopeptide repeat protein n=1 Tax=Rhodovulum sp. ES.010 TaxID=1882821 RepID=UPI00092B2863|nr:tetratricopeptide repeat protein [Rhodovulum sp. ES.010]SIO53861.1 Flp pilus assembly protein TadD, contains TPR repeats [Rhodovulum sp. ES.010]
MRHSILVPICLVGALALSGCGQSGEAEVERAVQDVISSDESSLNAIMMTAADPDEAIAYFRRNLEEQPDKIAFQRGLAKSLVRGQHNTEAAAAWARVVKHPEATDEDRVNHADALVRVGKWDEAEAVLDAIPPTFETYKRYRLEAMIADSNEEWGKADSFYETAAGLTTRPSGVFNNWGYSKLTRGDYPGAERLFIDAITYDPSLFTAKNNLVLARGAQRNYDLPVIEMTPTERAQLYHTLALTAIKQGDISIGKGLLQDAIDTHPQHFDAAVRALKALEGRS